MTVGVSPEIDDGHEKMAWQIAFANRRCFMPTILSTWELLSQKPCIRGNLGCLVQVKDMRMSIFADQQRLVQWAEEKVALAGACHDLIDWHCQKLTREIRAFDSELKVSMA